MKYFFFLIIYDKDFYVKGNFRKRRLRDSCFHLGEREGNRNEQVCTSTRRRNRCVDSNNILKEKFFLYFVFNKHYLNLKYIRKGDYCKIVTIVKGDY